MRESEGRKMDAQIQAIIAIFSVALLGAVGYKLWQGFKTAVHNAVDENFKQLAETIDGINHRLDTVSMETCKNFLVRCLADIDRGDELTETESQRFKEQYDFYIKHDGNTYIKDKYEKSKAEGKL